MRIVPQYHSPGEVRQHAFDFASQVEIATAGETLTGTPTITVTRISGTGTVTAGSPTISTTKVLFTLSGGALDDRHRILCTVGTSAGRTLQATGELRIAYST